ncbi:MAG: hypothetical protein RML12_00255 [Xanthomonadales bacterium]|nr:hypothetical protein [Xanthomonadales bacterium]
MSSERLTAALAGRYELDGAVFDHPGASVGVAFAAPGETVDQLIARADLAMYRCKRLPG